MKHIALALTGLVGIITPPNPLQDNDLVKADSVNTNIVKIVYLNLRTNEEYVAHKSALGIRETPAASHTGEECRIRLGENWAGFFCYNQERTVTYVAEGRIVDWKVKWQPKGTPLDHMADMGVGSNY